MQLHERKKFIRLHAIAQGININDFDHLLNNIDKDVGYGIGDWCEEFVKVATTHFDNKKYADALHYYNLARFPFIDSDSKQKAYENCIISFNEWCKSKDLIVNRLTATHEAKEIPFYLYKCSKPNRPLLLVMGGIVSIKEQWYKFLLLGKALGFSVSLIDFLGVGENSLTYQPSSAEYIKKILNLISRTVNVESTHCIAMSFAGNLCLKLAAEDARIKSVITIGAPIYYSFIDEVKWNAVPEITKMTLKKITQANEVNLLKELSQFALTEKTLAKIKIPLCYIFSNQDEIISDKEKTYLLQHYPNLFLYSFDDEHGSPNHFKQIKNIIIYNLLKFSNTKIILRNFIKLKNVMAKKQIGFSFIKNKKEYKHEQQY